MNEQKKFLDALLDPSQPPPSELTSWNGSKPISRFSVYRNNVVVSLIEALVDTYSATQELVGKDFFRTMARLFINTNLPLSPVLTFYGESFPDFIECFAPATSVPYLSDVARLELLRVRSYHAPDNVEFSTDTISQALAHTDQLPDLIIEIHPSAKLLRSQYAVVSLWSAHQKIIDISGVDPYVPENALIVRPHLNVNVIQLDAGDSEFVAHLISKKSLGDAVKQVSAVHSNFNLASIISILIKSRAILSTKVAKK